MAVVPGFVASEWDRGDQRAIAFPGIQVVSGLIRRNLNIPYFETARTWMPVVLSYYARGRCIANAWPAADYEAVIAAAEMIAPNLPDENFMTVAQARRRFVRYGLESLARLGYENLYSTGLHDERPVSGHQAVNTILGRIPVQCPDDTDTFIHALLGHVDDPNAGLPAITDAMYTAHLAEAVALLLNLLASHSTARGRATGTKLYTLIYVSLAKRGTITNAKLASITNAVSQETNLNVDVSTEEIKACANAMLQFVDGTNAEAIMTGLANNMQNLSLRLKLTVMQAAKSGMTCYWAIYEAIRVFTDFPWGDASRYIPSDFAHYSQAFAEVGTNEYYGFNQDLGIAKHTEYKSLSWLAIKLLVKFKGSEFGSLNQYRGLPQHPDREQDLQSLIDHYEPPVQPNPMENIAEILAQIRG